MKEALSHFRKLFKREDGIVSIEFAFVAIALITLMIGIFDFGRYAFEMSRVESAARAGTQSGIRSAASALDTASVEAAAVMDLGNYADKYNVTARRFCACAGTEVACTAECADGIYAPMYSEVKVIGEHRFLFDYPSVNNPATVAAVSRLRLR